MIVKESPSHDDPLIFTWYSRFAFKRKPRLGASAPFFFLSPHPQQMCERLVFICAQSWSWRGKRCRAVKLKEEIHQRGVMNLVQSQLGREALWAKRCGEFWWSRFLCRSNGLGMCVCVCVAARGKCWASSQVNGLTSLTTFDSFTQLWAPFLKAFRSETEGPKWEPWCWWWGRILRGGVPYTSLSSKRASSSNLTSLATPMWNRASQQR